MKVKLNCEQGVDIQGKVKKLTDNKFILKSEGLAIPCRIDCRIPTGMKDDDFVLVYAKLRYSNDNDTHKLILDKIIPSQETSTPINKITIEGYVIEPIYRGKGKTTFMFRHNVLNAKGEVYRCLVEVLAYGKVSDKIQSIVKIDELYIIKGSLSSKDRKVIINAEHIDPSTAIERDI